MHKSFRLPLIIAGVKAISLPGVSYDPLAGGEGKRIDKFNFGSLKYQVTVVGIGKVKRKVLVVLIFLVWVVLFRSQLITAITSPLMLK